MSITLTEKAASEVKRIVTEERSAGRLPEAKAQYDALFHGEPPTLDLAVEYWRLVARLPGQEAKALKQLQALDQQYSGNAALRMSLARMLFSQNQDAQAYELLQKIAADPAGRGEGRQEAQPEAPARSREQGVVGDVGFSEQREPPNRHGEHRLTEPHREPARVPGLPLRQPRCPQRGDADSHHAPARDRGERSRPLQMIRHTSPDDG